MVSLKELLKHLNASEPVVFGSKIYDAMMHYTRNTIQLYSQINCSGDLDQIRRLFFEITEQEIDPSFCLFPPFNADFGKNIKVGKNVFINGGCSFQDQGGILIGDNTLIGPKCVLATLNHGLKADERSVLLPKPIIIGQNVWIGANVTILSNVTIGDNAVIAAGSVVNKDVLKNTLVAGVPAKFIKNIE